MPRLQHVVAWFVCASIAAIAACETSTSVPPPTPYAATLQGSKVQPTAVTTSATGALTAVLHPTNRTLAYTVSWSALSGVPSSAHVHGPAMAGAVGAIIVDFSALPTGSTGTATMTATGSATGTLDLKVAMTSTVSGDSLRKLLDAGRAYVDVHTAANGAGEIRGQIARP